MDALERLAAVYRSDYLDYFARLKPVQDEVLTEAYNPEMRRAEQGASLDLVNQQAQATAGTGARRLASMGVTLSAEQQASQDRIDRHKLSLAQVDAINRGARNYDDRTRALVGGR